MPTHHPMDRLHQHLDKVAGHAARVHSDAHEAARGHDAHLQAERQKTVTKTVTEKGS